MSPSDETKPNDLSAHLAQLKALRASLTKEAVTEAVSSFQAVVEDQARIGELIEKYEIATLEAKVIADNATIFLQAETAGVGVSAGVLWDLCCELAQAYTSEEHSTRPEHSHLLDKIKDDVAKGVEPILLSDKARILAAGMLKATNSGKVS